MNDTLLNPVPRDTVQQTLRHSHGLHSWKIPRTLKWQCMNLMVSEKWG